ncbi:MAG: hypothetical protein IK137_02545 [Bacilli bacterium]|nr:hypothetical protein [Bacilli bacterium]
MKRKDEYMESAEKIEKGMLKFYAVAFGVGMISLGCLGVLGVRAILKTKEGQMQPTETTIETTIETTEETNLVDQLMNNVQQGEVKTFKEGEHYICVRIPHHGYSLGMNNPKENDELDVLVINNIPEGYEVYSITPYTSKVGNGSSTAGYDVWLVNTEKVKVNATYNNQTKQYGYYTFGEVVEEEKQLTK